MRLTIPTHGRMFVDVIRPRLMESLGPPPQLEASHQRDHPIISWIYGREGRRKGLKTLLVETVKVLATFDVSATAVPVRLG